jgi:hypothetical protein
MEALAVIGLVSNVLGFIDTTTKLCALLKEYSSIGGAPTEVVALSKRLDSILNTIQGLDESGRARLDDEKAALQMGADQAEELRKFLESLKIAPNKQFQTTSSLNWVNIKGVNLKLSIEKGWKAFRAYHGREKLEKFQVSLDRILSLIMMQQQSRVE